MSEYSRKPIVEMTADELNEAIEKKEAELGRISLRKPIGLLRRYTVESGMKRVEISLDLLRSELKKRKDAL